MIEICNEIFKRNFYSKQQPIVCTVQNLKSVKPKRKNISVSEESHQRFASHASYGQKLEDVILEKWEERKFQKRATPILEKAKKTLAKHQQIGTNWREVEESFRELVALLEQFLNELKAR